MKRTLAALSTAVVLALTGSGGAAATAAADDQPVPGKLLLMLDASGSMKAKDPSGLTKIEAAKKALTGVVTALPDTAQVGLRVYGAKVDGHGKPTPAACADTQLVHPIATLDKTRLTSTIKAIKALGETPIAHSLEEAMKDLGNEGKRNVVLVSDGEESCVPDPCPTVKKLTAAGVDLQIDTVGFGVNAKARQQLQCIADAGRGTYYDAKDAPALTASLNKLSQRALRPFTVSGTPVSGSRDPSTAPVLEPGQYVDALDSGAPAKHYRLDRAPGSTVWLSAAVRPGRSTSSLDEIQVDVKDAMGQQCTSALANRVNLSGLLEVMVASVAVPGDTDDPCAQGPLVAAVTRDGGSGQNVPVEIIMLEEPAVTSLEALPAAVPNDEKATIEAGPRGAARPIVGGGGFSDAPTIAPGTYTEVVLPGEQLFYKVRLDFGQSAAMTVDLPDPTSEYPRFEGADAAMFDLSAWTPARASFNHAFTEPSPRETFWGKTPEVANEFIPEIRYRNREGDPLDVAPASLPGYYYFSIARENEGSTSSANVPLTLRMRFAVNGEAAGRPVYAGIAPDASASPSSSPSASTEGTTAAGTDAGDSNDDGSNLPLWLGLGAVVVLGAIGTAYTILRTRRGAHPDGPPAPGV